MCHQGRINIFIIEAGRMVAVDRGVKPWRCEGDSLMESAAHDPVPAVLYMSLESANR